MTTHGYVRRPGFDRVTFELTGDGQAGWFATYTDEALQQGSGRPVDVDGDAVLELGLRGMLFPPDRPENVTGIDDQRVAAPTGAQGLREVVVEGIFEGQQQVFVGVEAEVAYRLARLEDPQRIVIDLVHDG